MKKIIAFALLAIGLGPWKPAMAETRYNANLVNDTCIAADTNYDLNLNQVDATAISFVASYSSTTLSAKTFTDGRKSTASITVSSYLDLIARQSTMTIQVQTASSSTLSGQSVTLNGTRFLAGPGGSWQPATTATGSAVALAAAIDAHADFAAVAVSSVVFATTTVSGAFTQDWTGVTTSSTVLRLNGGSSTTVNFQGGRNNAMLGVQGVTFRHGTGFTAATSNAVTAKAISDALMANATLAALFTSTWSAAGVVTATATAVGTNAYTLFTSTPNALRLNGSASAATDTFLNGSESKVDIDNDLITSAGHGYGTGLAVLYTTSPVTSGVGGLVNGTTYFVIRNDYDRIKLATTKANAIAGTAINLTAPTGAGTYTLTPKAISGTPSFKWQVSNNGSSFFDLSVTSVTITSSSVTAWDFANLAYKTLRLKFTSSTDGCASVTAMGSGRR